MHIQHLIPSDNYDVIKLSLLLRHVQRAGASRKIAVEKYHEASILLNGPGAPSDLATSSCLG